MYKQFIPSTDSPFTESKHVQNLILTTTSLDRRESLSNVVTTHGTLYEILICFSNFIRFNRMKYYVLCRKFSKLWIDRRTYRFE